VFDENADAVHILGGIRVGAMMTQALAEGAKRKAKMGSLSEPYERSGWKGKLRDLKYQYLRMFYFRYIDFFLAVGKEGVATYTRLGFNPERVFPWAYFVSVPVPAIKPATTEPLTRIIYAGRIEAGKGITRFTEHLAQSANKNYRLDIYGGGPEEESLKQYVAANGLGERVRFFPFLPYNDLVKQYAQYDWVVLPSIRKDGWGVIVSEGLLNGLKAICSNKCGVSWAIKENYNGVTFDWGVAGSCHEAISRMLTASDFAGEAAIKQRAQETLSGEAGAAYYLKIIDSVYQGKPKPGIPWLK
jgi:glycosyltransferase involved in cell wall biosynthesis